MRLKRKYYDTSRSYAYTFVFYDRDLQLVNMKAMGVSQQHENALDVLHALLIMTKNIEDYNAEAKRKAETKG